MAQFASAVILLAVSACTVMSAEERLAEFGQTCEAYGFQPTNDAYAECIQREVHALLPIRGKTQPTPGIGRGHRVVGDVMGVEERAARRSPMLRLPPPHR